jgi:hypothetical protein
MTPTETFLWGLFGGLGAEASVVFAFRHRGPSEYPYWLKSWTYYFVAAVMVLIGGVIAVAYAKSGTTLNAMLAIQIGASTPLIFRKLSENIPDRPEPPDPSRID